MTVAVVTDSTACLPAALVAESDLRVVPVQVLVDGRPRLDGVNITPSEVADALQNGRPVTTSRPTPQQFEQTYTEVAAAGATAIVSVHLSRSLSGTHDAARLAARHCGVPVIVVDSGTVIMGLGFSALNAVKAGRSGASAQDVADVAQRTGADSEVLFYVDTLEFLRRGGRIGNASAMLGTALRVKPLLHVRDGRVAPLEKARTASRALARLEELALEAAEGREVQIAVQHLTAADRAETLAENLRERLGLPVVIGEVGAVMGVHVGPGVVAVSISPRYQP